MRATILLVSAVVGGVVWAAGSAGGQAPGSTPREALTVKLEMDFPVHEVQPADYESPVVTHNGSIYAAWVDDQLRTMVARKSPDGTVQTSVVFPRTIEDRYHVAPSIGVDRDGYIHLTGNMHNSPDALPDFIPVKSPWQYAVSDRPEDISSFTFLGDDPGRSPPGRGITYPLFASDSSGELYLTFRHRVKYGTGWSPGIMAGAVAHYDPRARRWDMLGGTDYVHGEKTLFWTAKPGGGSAYQGFKVRIFFDRDNRMHLATVMHESGSVSLATHVVYACSDDGGRTFRRADGSPYESLPITLRNGDIVVGPPWVDEPSLHNKPEVGVGPGGRPIVGFWKRGEREGKYVSRWSPEAGWSDPETWPGLYFVTDPQGVITLPAGDWLRRSHDDGRTWQSHATEASWCMIDMGWLAATRQVRFRTLQDGRFAVWTATFE